MSFGAEDKAAPTGQVDETFWQGRRVLITGHTGFKGAWLSLWLQLLGADVTGVGATPPTTPSLYEMARVGEHMHCIECDVRDFGGVSAALTAASPEVVIHMAAQPLVRRSYVAPRETYETNVMGTVNVLEAVRRLGSVRAVVVVSSDKCYENRGADAAGFSEDSRLGGHDPYSSSKACTELVAEAYRRSFFEDPEGVRLASARAGNVIGGGDWAEDRLLPDLIGAATEKRTVLVRNPGYVRPWQHVLNPLSGYLLLAQELSRSADYAGAWNFGPPSEEEVTVATIVQRVSELWPGGLEWETSDALAVPEAAALRLDSSKAERLLGWSPPLGLDAALGATVRWFRDLREGADARAVTVAQIETLA
jgi:CDP-glucose 4,6-dehydratase